jgi:hypothetical protein
MFEVFGEFLVLLKIVFLGKAILLTPVPVDIQEQHRIFLEKPITAVTGGARIKIVTSETKTANEEMKKARETSPETSYDLVLSFQKKFKELYPEGSIVVKLCKKNESCVILNKGSGPWPLTSVDSSISFFHKDGVPEGEKYYTVEVITKVPLKEVEVTWENYSI